MDEIAMRAMYLDNVEPGIERELRGAREVVDGALDLLTRHRARGRVVTERDVAGPECLPTAFVQRQRLSAQPRLVARSLAARVRDLDRGHGAVIAQEAGNRRPRARMRL
jgi:hypothetical protein